MVINPILTAYSPQQWEIIKSYLAADSRHVPLHIPHAKPIVVLYVHVQRHPTPATPYCYTTRAQEAKAACHGMPRWHPHKRCAPPHTYPTYL